MTYQLNQFSRKYENIDFEISLTSDYNFDEIIWGKIIFFDYPWEDGVEEKNM